MFLESLNKLDLGERVRRLAAMNGYNQAFLAKALGLTASTTSLKLHGKVAFTVNDLTSLADLFHVSVDALLGREAVK